MHSALEIYKRGGLSGTSLLLAIAELPSWFKTQVVPPFLDLVSTRIEGCGVLDLVDALFGV